MLKVLVVDDSPLFRRGVRDLAIEGFHGVKIGEAGNVYEMLELLRKKPWDMAVMDISMPGMNGLDALKQVKQEFPDLPVLILSMHPEEQYAIRMFKAGADGYLTKAAAPEELVQAIKKVRGRQICKHFAGGGPRLDRQARRREGPSRITFGSGIPSAVPHRLGKNRQ
jgi:DNA-binding NarL/FixJ family response regulator